MHMQQELLKKKERIANIRSQMFEILNVLETIPPRDLEETHAPPVERGLIALREALPVFPMQVITTVAKRPAGQRPKGSGASRKRAAGPSLPQQGSEAAAPISMQRRASLAKRGSEQRPVVVDTNSDYSDSSALSSTCAGFFHGSDHEEDSQTSISAHSDEDLDFES